MTIQFRFACLTWIGLLLLLALTAASSQMALGWANAAINLAIAAAKALLILIVFMGLQRDTLLPRLAAFGMLLWLIIMVALTLTDYLTR